MKQFMKTLLSTPFLLLPLAVIAAQQEAQKQEKTNSTSGSSEVMDHAHLPIEVPDGAPKPALSIDLVADSMNGYNLYLLTQRYSLTPTPKSLMTMSDMMEATIDDKTGFVDGHAHLYVNGEKVQRIYGNAVHMPQTLFKKGINVVTVTINNHGHMYWTVDDKKVVATIFFKNEGELELTHRFESFPVQPD